jgi:predicted small integral membrane protein
MTLARASLGLGMALVVTLGWAWRTGRLDGVAAGLQWMAWTWQTGLFFTGIVCTLVIMTFLAVYRPETERVGVLRIATTRGDRLFISLLGAAFIHLGWIGLTNAELWWASIISLVYAAAVFRWV